MKKSLGSPILLIFLLQLIFANNLLSQSPATLLNDSIIFFDDFDSYTPGESLYGQNPEDWFMFTGAPGPWSPKITDTFALSNPNAVTFNYSWETIIKPMDNYDTGIYFIDFFLYLPDNKTASFYTFNYFNGEDIYYGMQVAFNELGQGSLFAGEFDSTIFNYSYDTWLENRVAIDLNTDWAAYYLNNNLISSWIWSSGIYGGGEPKLLGGSEFIGHYYGDTEFLLDNYKLTKVDNSFFFDYFETYTNNEQLACQKPDSWTTWNLMPCFSEDPFVIDTFSFDGAQSIFIQDSNNLVKAINNLNEGIYKISFQMYIPEGNEGVYNILQEFGEDSTKVGCRANFHSDGYLTFDNGTMSQPSPYPVNSWMKNEYYINLNEDWANFYLNDILYCEWSWSWGVTGQNNLKQLGGVNFTTSSWQINEACYFIDNFSIMEVDSVPCFHPPTNLDYTVSSDMVTITWDPPPCPDLMGFNIYYEGTLIDFTNSQFYILPNEPGTYEYCITCVYESGESNCAWITIVITETGEVAYPGITVFPNPANEKFRIQSDEKISIIEVYNLSGQLKLQKKNLNLFQLDVNTSVLSTGSYILKIETRGNIAYKRIILQ